MNVFSAKLPPLRNLKNTPEFFIWPNHKDETYSCMESVIAKSDAPTLPFN